MGAWRTIADRKRDFLDAYRRGVETLTADLAGYARLHGGRFILYGSAVRGPVHDRSDVDVIADFPGMQAFEACSYVERRCSELGLLADARPAIWASEKLMARAAETGRVLP